MTVDLKTQATKKPSKPCTACAHNRRRCPDDCLFRPYLPKNAENTTTFHNINKLFGQENVLRLLKELQPDQRDDAMKSIVFEANAWAAYPGQGCVPIIRMLLAKLNVAKTELGELHQLLDFHKSLNEISSSSSGQLGLNVQSTRCAACAYENRNCKLECPFQHYFLNNDDENRAAYIKVQNLFSYDNVLELVRNMEPEQRDQAMKSLIFEADAWNKYPGQGCIRIVNELQEKLTAQLVELNDPHQLACFRGLTNHESLGESRMSTKKPGVDENKLLIDQVKDSIKCSRDFVNQNPQNPNGREILQHLCTINSHIVIVEERLQMLGRQEELVMENQEMSEELKKMQMCLVELHQVFRDITVLGETQGGQHQLDMTSVPGNRTILEMAVLVDTQGSLPSGTVPAENMFKTGKMHMSRFIKKVKVVDRDVKKITDLLENLSNDDQRLSMIKESFFQKVERIEDNVKELDGVEVEGSWWIDINRMSSSIQELVNELKVKFLEREKVVQILGSFRRLYTTQKENPERCLSKSGKQLSTRLDIAALKLFKEGGGIVLNNQCIGSVPGVKIGDLFEYRIEMYLVGLHRLLEGGIDYTSIDGRVIALCVVASASGPYRDVTGIR